MKFNTQRELLEYAGKNPNDRSLIQRWRIKGKVYMEDGMYVLVEDDVDSLRRENEELRQKLKEKSDCTPSVKDAVVGVIDSIQGVDVQELRDRIKELESDLEYVNGEYEKMEGKLIKFQEAIRNCYMWARDVKKDKTSRPDFKKNILKLEEDVRGEDNQ